MYLSRIQTSLDYIEENLKTDITAKELYEINKKMTAWMIQAFKDLCF